MTERFVILLVYDSVDYHAMYEENRQRLAGYYLRNNQLRGKDGRTYGTANALYSSGEGGTAQPLSGHHPDSQQPPAREQDPEKEPPLQFSRLAASLAMSTKSPLPSSLCLLLQSM